MTELNVFIILFYMRYQSFSQIRQLRKFSPTPGVTLTPHFGEFECAQDANFWAKGLPPPRDQITLYNRKYKS